MEFQRGDQVPASAGQIERAHFDLHESVWTLLQGIAPFGYIAGGHARWALLGGPDPHDIDVFLYTNKPEDRVAAEDVLNRTGWHYTRRTPYFYEYEREPEGPGLPGILQLIWDESGIEDQYNRFHGLPGEVLGWFAFEVERAALWATPGPDGPVLRGLLGENTAADLVARRLTLRHITNPVSVALRMARYTAKGFSPLGYEDVLALFDIWEARGEAYRQMVRTVAVYGSEE